MSVLGEYLTGQTDSGEPLSCEVRAGRHGAARSPVGLFLPDGKRLAVGDHPLAVVLAREVERAWHEDMP